MRIMYDGMNLQLQRGTGVATYGRNLVAAMRSAGHEVMVLYGLNPDRRSKHVIGESLRPLDGGIPRSRTQYVLDMQRANFGFRVAKARRAPGRHDLDHWFPPADSYLNVPRLYMTAGERFRHKGRFTAVWPPMRTHIAHWTYPMAVRARGAVNVYTIHDMVQSRHPELTLDDPKRHAALLGGIAARADHILTVSEHSRRDIIDVLGLPEDRVSNVYQPVVIPADTLSGAAAAVDDAIARHLGPEVGREGYFLFIGAIEPKKNLDRLIEAYAAAAPRQPLVVIGGVGWLAEQTLERIEATPNVRRLGHLPRQDMLALLAGARALCFPSLYEGFGLPVVEGFLCGAPVITAKGHSTEEIAGDAALLADPYDVGEIKTAIERLAEDDSEDLRRTLAARGKSRAARFEPDRVARDMEAVYRRILTDRRGRRGGSDP